MAVMIRPFQFLMRTNVSGGRLIHDNEQGCQRDRPGGLSYGTGLPHTYASGL